MRFRTIDTICEQLLLKIWEIEGDEKYDGWEIPGFTCLVTKHWYGYFKQGYDSE